jgi:S-adenosylmethionine:tRNA ribosyltransferase-isomerase
MLVVYRQEGRWEDRTFRDFPSFVRHGDCVVLNNSRVIRSRLFGRRGGVRALPVGKRNPKRLENLSGQVEVFLLKPQPGDGMTWTALVRPGRKMHVGEVVRFAPGFEAEITGRGEFGERTLHFSFEGDLYDALEAYGHVPLPPYIKRADEAADCERYQTVFASEKGSVAAPTAGLHFTAEILDQCRQAGAELVWVTLHVGLGTFQPLHADEVEQNHLHAETFFVPDEAAQRIRNATRRVAVGTTSVRTVESMMRGSTAGETDIFIYPGFEFRAVDAMLTNFHLPGTSLLLLVCAFGGKELMLDAYRHAVQEGYRFFSYGDCMLIL